MQRTLEGGRSVVKKLRRVGWNGGIQWLLLLTLLTPLLLGGPRAPQRIATVSASNAPVASQGTEDRTSRVDPRIKAAASSTPEQVIRVIVQKLAQDRHLEEMVVALGGTVLADLPIINAFAAEMPADAATQLALLPAVRWISIDGEVHSSLLGFRDPVRVEPQNTYLETLDVPPLWEQGLDGKGIGVAIIDSGIANDSDFANLAKNKGFALNSLTPIDLYGHGTHIAGIVAGTGLDSLGKYRGIAPGTTLIGLKVSNDLGLAFESDVVKALQWTWENKEQYNIRVVNLSINSGVESSYHNSPLNAAAEILWFSGVTIVVSAGNSGGQNGINTVQAAPANDPFFITVGASDELGTTRVSDDVVAAYSAAGMTPDGYLKPDIVAPGTGIYSVLSKYSIWGLLYPDRVAGRNQYFRMSGTSMSAPMVVGVISLLLQDEPDLTPDQVKYRLLNNSGRTISMQLDGKTVNFPYLDADAVVNGSSTQSANTGLQASQLLWTGNDPIQWNSVNWNSVNWNSVNWNSVNWNSVNWNSVVLEPPRIDGILPLAEGESWETPALPTEVPDVDFEPQLDDLIDSFIYMPQLGQ